MNCREAVQVSAGRCGGGVSKPGFSQDGDGADDRTGWPAVFRGRREQYAVHAASSTGEQHLGEGVGCGRAHREVRQWGSKPEQMQDGRRGWLPKWRCERPPAGRSSYSEGKNGGVERHQDRPGERCVPGYRRTSIVRWSPVKQPRSPQPSDLFPVGMRKHRAGVADQGRLMV